MTELANQIANVDLACDRPKSDVMKDLISAAKTCGYTVVDIDMEKPWGGYVRFDTITADDFINNFFPGLDANEARLGNPGLELSPKFLLVSPSARLSWQRHSRRAERWAYLTDGAYYKSLNPDEQGNLVKAQTGSIVQFSRGECHRLVGQPGGEYTLVAEIWQHTDPSNPSEESDIERLQDDYKR